MCFYRYVYYSNCRHAEFIRMTYCKRAEALGLPQWDDNHRPGTGGSRNASSGADRDSGNHTPRKPTSGGYRQDQDPPPASGNTQQPGGSSQAMSLIRSSDPVSASNWANTATSDDEPVLNADHIPRSQLPSAGVPSTYARSTAYENRQDASQNSSSSDNPEYGHLTIDLPFDNFSNLSMEFSSQDGSTRTRISGPSTAQPESDSETVRAFPLSHQRVAKPSLGEASSYSSQTSDSSKQHSTQPPFTDSSPSTLEDQSRGGGLMFRGNSATRANAATLTEDLSSPSPRKPIPPQWLTKPEGPKLNTAQRAQARASRNRNRNDPSHSPISTNSKTVCGARTTHDLGKYRSTEGTAFLTKDTAVAVDSDLTSMHRSPTKVKSPRLRHNASKSSLKSPTGSPIRGKPTKRMTVLCSTSPSSASTEPSSPEGSSLKGLFPPSKSPGQLPSPVCSDDLPFFSARQSPVSQSSRSEDSFVSAEELHGSMIPHLDLANTGDDEQISTKPAILLSQARHNRGKPNPPPKPTGGKANEKKVAVPSVHFPPKLTLQIPHNTTAKIESKSPGTLGSSSASSLTAASPSTSRIPRLPTSLAMEHVRLGTADSKLKGKDAQLPKSGKTLKIVGQNGQPESKASAGDIGTQSENKTRGLSTAVDATATVEPQGVPLTDTPVTGTTKHMKSLNSSGTNCNVVPSSCRVAVTSSTQDFLGVPARGYITECETDIDTPPGKISDATKLMATARLEEGVVAQKLKNPDASSYNQSTTEDNSPYKGIDPWSDAIIRKVVSEADNANTERESSTAEDSLTKAESRSRVASEATVTARPPKEELAGKKPADIHSYKKSDTLADSEDAGIDKDEMFTAASTGRNSSQTAEGDAQTSPAQDRGQQHTEHIGIGSVDGLSGSSSLSSDLRATAPAFIPAETTFRPSLPTDWLQPQPPPLFSFDPRAVDLYTLWHSVYPIVPFEYHSYGAFTTPTRKGKGRNKSKKPYTPSNNTHPLGHRSQGTNTTQGEKDAPTKSHAAMPRSQEDTTAHAASHPSDAKFARVPGKEPSHNGNSLSPPSTEAFKTQMEEIASTTYPPISAQSAPPPNFDWSPIINVRSQSGNPYYTGGRHTSNIVSTSLSTTSGQNPNVGFSALRHSRPHRGNGNGLYDTYAYGRGRGRGLGYDVRPGVPLSATDPFPDPVPPPGPRILLQNQVQGGAQIRGDSQPGTQSSGRTEACKEQNEQVGHRGEPKEHLEYSVRKKKKRPNCGHMHVLQAMEWGGGTCNACEPDH